MVDFSKFQLKGDQDIGPEIIPEIILGPKKDIKQSKKAKKTGKKDNDHKITSDAIRTAYYLFAGKSSRKRIEDVKSDLIKILNEN